MVGSGFAQSAFKQHEQPLPVDRSLGMVPPGYGDPDFGEDQVKIFLKAQRQVQEEPTGLNQLPNNSNNSKWGQAPDEWSGPTIPAGPNSFATQPPKADAGILNKQNKNNFDKNSGNTPERETTPTPEDNMDFGEEPGAENSNKDGQSDEKPISQRKVYEELQRKHKEKEMRLESVKEPNPMFKEDNWYSSEEESEEKSDRSFSEELLRTPANLKRKSPEKKTIVEEYNTEGGSARILQTPAVTTTILSLRETPATPPPPPTLSASDRDSMEASAATNGSVALPKELTQVLSSIQTTPSSSTSFESNTSSPATGKRDPR